MRETTEKAPSETRRAIRTCIIAQTLGAPLPQVLINGGVLSLFLLALGGSKFAVGSIFAVNFLSMLVRVLVAPFIDVAYRKRFTLVWITLATLIFAGFFLAWPIYETFGSTAAVWYVVGLFFFQRISINIGGHAWLSLLTVIIPGPLRGRFFARMRTTFQVVSLAMVGLIGWYLGADPAPGRFILVFAVLFAMALARPFLLLSIPNPPPDRQGPRAPVFKNMFHPLRDRGWREFIVFYGALSFTANMARPFAVPFLKEDLGFPASITAYSAGSLILGMVLGLMPWGRLADKLGNKVVFLINILVLSVAFVILAFTPSYTAAPVLSTIVGIVSFMLTGIAIGGLGIGHTVRQMHAAPSESRSSYMAVFFMVAGLVAAAATLLSGALLDQFPTAVGVVGLELSPIRLFFMLSSLLVMSTAVLLWRLDSVAEKPIQIAVVELLSLLPPKLTFPLRAVDLDPHQTDRD